VSCKSLLPLNCSTVLVEVLHTAEQHAKEADLAICLGTSLQITPACNLPLRATRVYKGGQKQQPGQLAIINLQRTQV
jgi:mono-ADP-ribosyltransferase sirtuin 6